MNVSGLVSSGTSWYIVMTSIRWCRARWKHITGVLSHTPPSMYRSSSIRTGSIKMGMLMEARMAS